MLALLLMPCSPTALAESPPAEVSASLDGTLAGYRVFAAENSPAVAAAYARWEAATHSAAGARALPEPRLGLSVFIRSIETRVGPQQARLSIQQALPWPSAWSGQVGAARAEAERAAHALDAALRAQQEQTEAAYWRLWLLRAERRLHDDHLTVIEGLSAVVRARLEVGSATLADLQQVDLTAARLADAIERLRAEEAEAQATLGAVLGLADAHDLPTTATPPEPARPALGAPELRERAQQHPSILGATERVAGASSAAQVARAQRLPGLSVGADWIPTGHGTEHEAADSGKDAVAVGVGLSVPLWQRAHSANIDAAQAQVRAAEADLRAASVQATASASRLQADVRDSARRVQLTAETLLPQAEAAYASLLGSYTTGDGSVAQVLLSQRDLLELRVSLAQARAAHATAWAALEALCGPLQRTPISESP